VLGFIEYEIKALPSRALTEKTCDIWKYGVGMYQGEKVQVANYFDPDSPGTLVAQHIKFSDKRFKVLGDSKAMCLYGQWLWRDGGRRVVITTGTLDAPSISQLQDHKWPVVSVPNGDNAAKKAISAQLNWLLKFEEVVLCFDMDESGQKALQECVKLFPPGRCKVASLPMKDANDMLKAKRGEELINALWAAKAYRPDGIVTVRDIRAKILEAPVKDLDWCLTGLNEDTYGRRYGEIVGLGAGTGCGKTTLLAQQIAFDIEKHGNVGMFAFEAPPKETAKRVAGMIAGRTFHIPESGWTDDELDRALAFMDDSLFLYDHFGACTWDVVKEHMRFLAHDQEVRIFYLDHLTALAAAEDDERKALEKIMAELSGIAQELSAWIGFVSHLTTPEGKPHEEGGRVTIRHFKGSRAIGFWSYDMLAMERDTQAPQDAKPSEKLTTLRVLKNRYAGRALGKTYMLSHTATTGRFEEVNIDELRGREAFSEGSPANSNDDF
jgi:twinkle protein